MSIRSRLALWYAAIFAIALVVLGLLLYSLMERHLDSMVGETVATRAEHLSTAIHPIGGDSDGPLELPPLDAFEAPEVYVQILAPGGTVIQRSSNLQGRTLPLPGETLHQSDYHASLDGVGMRVRLAPIRSGGTIVAWVQVAASFRERDIVLRALTWSFVIGGLGGTLVAGLVGALLAGRILRPVSDMTETARAIALSRGFSRRLPFGDPKDELGQLSITFNEMLASLEEAYAAQQRFTADASHELRAPLTIIQGNLDLLERVKDMPDEERSRALALVRGEVSRLSRLVGDLLALARSDAGEPLQVGPIELDALVIQAHRQARSLSNGISVGVSYIEACEVQGDEDRLRQLLLILVDNAVRYTADGGTVTLSLRRDPPWAVIGVSDTGVGIDPEDLPHVFDRFWRADPARAKDRAGTGLGLAIAKRIVERHGGEILVESAPGKGSAFLVHLPLPGS